MNTASVKKALIKDVTDDDAAAAFSSSSVAMVLSNPHLEDNPIVYVNKAFEKLTGYSSQAVLGRNCRFLQSSNTSSADINTIREAVAKQKEVAVVLVNQKANGEEFLNALLISPVMSAQTGELEYFIGLQSEVGHDKQLERLEVFENLVSEVQHRVKNHLAMILGLIRLKARGMDDKEQMADLSRRIESLQLLYEEMTTARDYTNENKIQLGSYLGRIANAIAHLDGRPGVRMNVHVDPLVVETETAVRIGLILSEILTNAMQHAFENQTSGLVEVRVVATDGGGMRAIVSDDGVGLPEGVDWPNSDGLGGRIVEGLVVGLSATLNVTRGAVGTIITLDVPAANEENPAVEAGL